MNCRPVLWASAAFALASCSNQHGSLITIKTAAPITDGSGAPLAGNAVVDVELFLGTAPDGVAAAEGTSWIRDVSATNDQLANVTAAQLESGISVLLDPTSPHAIDGVQLAVAAWPHDGPAPTAASALWFGHVLLNLDPSLTLGYTVTLANTPTSVAKTVPVDCPQSPTTTAAPSVYLWSGDSDSTDSCIRWVDANGSPQQQIVRLHDRDCDGVVPAALPLASCQYKDLVQCDPSVTDDTTVGWVDSDGDGYAENTMTDAQGDVAQGVHMDTCLPCFDAENNVVPCDCLLSPADFSSDVDPTVVQQIIAQMNPRINADAPEIPDGFDDNCDSKPYKSLPLEDQLYVASDFTAQQTCEVSAVAYPGLETEEFVHHTVFTEADTHDPIADAASNVCLDFNCQSERFADVAGQVPCTIALESPQDFSPNVLLPPIPVCTARYSLNQQGRLCQIDGSTTYTVSLTKLLAPVAQLSDYNNVGCTAQLWGTEPDGWDVELVDSSAQNAIGQRAVVSPHSCSNVILRITASPVITAATNVTKNPPVVVAIIRTPDGSQLSNLMAPIALISQVANCDGFSSPCVAPIVTNSTGGPSGGGPANGN